MIRRLLLNSQRLTNYFIPSKGFSYGEKSKSRVFVNSCFFIAILLTISLIKNFLIHKQISYSVLSLIIISLLLPYSLRLINNYKKLAQFFPLLVLLTTIPTIYLKGGLLAPESSWFFILPILSFYYAGIERGPKLSLLGLGAVIILFLLQLFHHEFPLNISIPPSETLYNETTVISLYILISYLIWNYEKLNIDTQKKLMESQEIAQKANKTKDLFWANIGHEFKTPLNGILGMSNLILDSQITREQRELIEIIKDSAEGLNIILSDVINYSKIETGNLKIEKKPFNLPQCLEEVILLFHHMAKDKNLKITYCLDSDIPQIILTDKKKLRQILINLLSNALKFTEEGEIKLLVEKSIKRNTLNFIIEDTGIGIPPQKIEKLFTPFTQIDDGLTRKYGGIGLGLAISKKILEHLDGGIEVKSKIGVGTIFKFWVRAIPLDIKTTQRNFLSPRKSFDSIAPLRILIVEDNPVNSKLLASLLQRNKIYPDIAANGLEALELAKEKSYDLIFMDIQMPIMDGITATQKIRALHKKEHPKIVALTANILQDERERCFKVGMDDFITKPLNHNILISILKRYSNQLGSPSSLTQKYSDKNKQNDQEKNSQIYETFDYDKITHNFGNDLEIMRDLLDQFSQDYKDTLHSIDRSIEEKNFQELERKAHSLKGIFSTFYCTEGRNLCTQLEGLAKESRLQKAPALVDNLKYLCKELIIELESFLTS